MDRFGQIVKDVERRMLLWDKTPVLFDDFNRGDQEPPQSGHWVRVSVTEVDAAQEGMGPRGLRLHDGIITLMVVAPLGSGPNYHNQLVTELEGLFRNWTPSSLTIFEPMVIPIGVDPIRKTWYQTNINIEFVELAKTPTGQLEGWRRMVFSKSAHGFSAGDFIYPSTAGWALADNGSTATEATALVLSVNGDSFVAVNNGYASFSHGYGQGHIVYLSTTAGTGSTSVPGAGKTQRLALAVDSTTLEVGIRPSST